MTFNQFPQRIHKQVDNQNLKCIHQYSQICIDDNKKDLIMIGENSFHTRFDILRNRYLNAEKKRIKRYGDIV